jgi:fermentation-respiration switch protein FrsA (DUF1100 family)
MTLIITSEPASQVHLRGQEVSQVRQDVVFRSEGLCCRGWLYVPEDLPPGGAPAIAMAHGFSGVKEMFLPRFAEHFAREGLVTLVFDYRYLGASDGEPRGQVFPHEQREDYRNAITWLSRRPEVDPLRIGVWGTSYSGGHVLHLAAFDRRIKAVVAQVPAVSIWRQILASGGKTALHGLLGLAALDRIGRFDGGATSYLKVVAPPGELCVLSTPDAHEWFEKAGAELAESWENLVTVESAEQLLEYDAAGPIELISPTPLLVIAAEEDSLMSLAVVRQAFERAGEPKKLLTLACGHFDVYGSEPWFAQAVGAAADFFVTHLG